MAPGVSLRADDRTRAAIVRTLILLPGLALLLVTGAAAADEPGQWVAAAGMGGAVMEIDGRWRPGFQAGAEARLGLAPAWALRGAVHHSAHPDWGAVAVSSPRPIGTIRATTAALGLVYAWDVLRVVPFGELGLAVSRLGGGVRQPGTFLGPQLGAGASYLLDRRWALAGVLRYQHLGLALGDGYALADAPSMLAAVLRLERYF
jgi:hypothetical protein